MARPRSLGVYQSPKAQGRTAPGFDALALGELRRRDPENDILPPVRLGSRADADAADLLDRRLRPHVVRPDHEDDAVHEPERVGEHQPLHFPVVGPTPVRPGQERPADLDLAPCPSYPWNRDEPMTRPSCGRRRRTPPDARASRKRREDVGLVPVAVGMLFPDERVGGDGVEGVEVRRPQGTEFDQLADEGRLKIERHMGRFYPCFRRAFACRICFAFSSSCRRLADRCLPARLMKN